MKSKRGSPQPPKDPAPLLPYIGLTQSCSVLRSEFRPAWLSTHKIPLRVLTAYLKAFFPCPDPRASLEAQKRLASQTSTAGSLRVWIRKSELANVDITRLIRHAVRLPGCRITMHALPDVPTLVLDCLQVLVTNKTNRWISGIRNYKITQVRLVNLVVRIVVAERCAPRWMRPLLPTISAPDGYTQGLGLVELEKGWTIHYGVDYS
jgi:hypothetical protein